MPCIKLNGEAVEIANGLNVEDALVHWQYGERRCAVAINGEFIPRTAYPHTFFSDRDEVDVVAPVGGG